MKKNNITKYIRLPEDYKNFPTKLLDAAFYNVINDFSRADLLCEMQESLKETKLIKARILLDDKNELKLNELKELMEISIQDAMCLAIFSYKKIFPGKLDEYE